MSRKFTDDANKGLGLQQPRNDTLHLLRNIPFVQVAKLWGQLPPAQESKHEIGYGEVLMVATRQVYRVSFHARRQVDSRGTQSMEWFIHQVELIK